MEVGVSLEVKVEVDEVLQRTVTPLTRSNAETITCTNYRFTSYFVEKIQKIPKP